MKMSHGQNGDFGVREKVYIMRCKMKRIARYFKPAMAVAAAALLAACDLPAIGAIGGGPSIDPRKPVPVAMLLPKSDAAASVAADLERAARMAMTDLNGVQIDLRVYDTGGQPATAAAQAQKAVDAGAKIILGPLYQESANAVGLAVLDEGINVLTFSNSTAIAGGNVFVLGNTFENTADRLMGYARKRGHKSVVVVHAKDIPGQVGRDAIAKAALNKGINVASVHGYALTAEGVDATARAAARAAQSTGANSVFLTTPSQNAAMPLLLQVMPEAGLNVPSQNVIGLGRLDVRPDLLSLPGANGAWFALPDQSKQQAFNSRFQSTYGAAAHPLASLGYDGIAAIGALVQSRKSNALTARSLTQNSGFQGAGGVFRLREDGTNQRAISVAGVQNKQVVILEPAPNRFGGAGF